MDPVAATRLIVKFDEDLAPSLTKLLDLQKYDVRTVYGRGWSGTPDVALFPLIVAEQGCFITADKGFGDLRAYPLGTHRGIVLLRPDEESRQHFADLLTRLMQSYDFNELYGCLAVVSPRNIRIRRPALER